jgi:multidrug efflux pump subunit AcrB
MGVRRATNKSNLTVPTGDARVGGLHYSVNRESMAPRVADFNDLPVRREGGRPVLVRDVGEAKGAYAIQTNAVRSSEPAPGRGPKRRVYAPVHRRPGANAIEVAQGAQERVPELKGRLPSKEGRAGLNLKVVAGQSVYVRENIASLLQEALLGGALASVMVLVFLGSVRSSVVSALIVPLSALAAVIGLYFTGQTLGA